MKRKIISKILAVMLALCMSISFVGCEKTGPIPDGRYEPIDLQDSTYYVYAENSNYDYFWEIEGDTARKYGSNALSFKAKIVEKNGKIYFEGYKWITIFHILGALFIGEKPTKVGSTNIYLVEYNAEEKSITVELYQKGD